jgi:hypothetical protein
MHTVAEIVEKVNALSLEEMEEIEIIIHKSILEKKAIEILSNQAESKELYKEGKLKFYDNSGDLLNALNEE